MQARPRADGVANQVDLLVRIAVGDDGDREFRVLRRDGALEHEVRQPGVGEVFVLAGLRREFDRCRFVGNAEHVR